MTTCPACRGKRTITEYVNELETGVSYPQNRTVERLHQCRLCRGSGKVTDLDVVLRATLDIQLAFSDRASDEQAAIDADKAAFESTLPDYDQHAHERVAAGLSPF